MSEWVSVLAVFWLLWALDGVRLAPRRFLTFVLGVGPGAARSFYSRIGLPGISPLSSRAVVTDVPLSFSPVGMTNQLAGSAGRPAEAPGVVRAWRWAEVREVGVAKGWIYVNGEAFCADSGHISAPELLALARLPAAEREKKLRAILARWFRVLGLRRRLRVLHGRTRFIAMANLVTLAVLALLTLYVAGDFASRLPMRWSEPLANSLPALLLAVLALHLAASIAAWRALRALPPIGPQKRGANLFSALLLPPQALRLRALLGEGFFPAQHPVALGLAFLRGRRRDDLVFNALADLRWPLRATDAAPLSEEIVAWFRSELERQLLPLVRAHGVSPEQVLTPPTADAPASCTYCPRCRDQFVAKTGVCPHGVELQPLPK